MADYRPMEERLVFKTFGTYMMFEENSVAKYKPWPIGRPGAGD